MNLGRTIIATTIRKVTGSSNDREVGSIHGVVVSDAYGNKPSNVWTPGTTGVSLRTDDGEVVPVFVRQYDLMPALALGWTIGDTLTIRGRMEKRNATRVFHDAAVRVTSQPEIEPDRINGAFRTGWSGKRNSAANERDKVNSRTRVTFFRSTSMRCVYNLIQAIRRAA